MTLRLAVRALVARPVRSVVLAGGFGLGISVMAALLGVGDVILEQARAPALAGGGDVLVSGTAGRVDNARFVLGMLDTPPLSAATAAAAPSSELLLYVVKGGTTTPVRARASIPSRDRALGDPEIDSVGAWRDGPSDRTWVTIEDAAVLRAMDRFHPVPDVPARAGSWAEWLYFNGRSGDGRSRLYLTFLVGPRVASGRRAAGVRLQLERDGRMRSFAEAAEIDEAALLASAPDLSIGGSSVRLDGLTYRVTLDLAGVRGSLALAAAAGRSLPPFEVHGARGWVSGYTVPVLSGALSGTLTAAPDRVVLDGGTGYHDHNWGFWEGVTWQWGQVAGPEVSLVWGRIHPPTDAADPERFPGFLVLLGPDGPLGFSTEVSIREIEGGLRDVDRLEVRSFGAVRTSIDLEVQSSERTPRLSLTAGRDGARVDFFQLRGTATVRAAAGERRFAFRAPASAETFRHVD